jgi:hypothetical protein
LKASAMSNININKIDIEDDDMKYLYNLMIKNIQLKKEILELNLRPPQIENVKVKLS